MKSSRTTRHISKSAVAGIAVGGFTFCVASFLAVGAWGTSTAPGAKNPAVLAIKNPKLRMALALPGFPASVGAAERAVANYFTHHAKHPTTPHTVPTELSSNWAGPVLTGGTYDQVVSTFVVPRASCSKQDTDSSFWAGLDGAGSSDTVEQAGVRVTCFDHAAEYVPWIEEFPAPESDISSSRFSVAPGDQVQVTVTANSHFDTYSFNDITSGATFTTAAAAPAGAAEDSAECVAEAPTGPKGIEKLTNFGTVSFSQCTAHVVAPVKANNCQLVTKNGCPEDSHLSYSNIGTRKHHSITLQAETMSTSGGGFSVTWHHS